MDYIITSVGHDIGLQMKYPKESLIRYKIKIRKHYDPVVKKNIKHGIKQHDNLDIISDIINLGVIAPAELLGHGLSTLTMGGVLERSTRKLIRAMTRSQQNMTVDLTVDNVR
jgi:hypothetical protein